MSIIRGVCTLGALTAAISAQAAELSLVVPAGTTTISPSGELTVEVFVNDILEPERLRGYQMTLEIVPGVGAVGSLALVDSTTPWPDNQSIFVDTARTDWVLSGLPAFDMVDPIDLEIAATLLSGTYALAVTEPKYCGTYILKASTDAAGDFQVRLVVADPGDEVQPTMLLNQDGALIRPITVVPSNGITVTVLDFVINDDCATFPPQVIPEGTTSFGTINATTDGPSHPGSGCDQAGSNTVSNDIWYEHTATCTGVLMVSTCGSADFDTRVAVYDTCTCPVTDGDLLVCNDNGPGCGLTSKAVATGVVQGLCYKVRVGATGDLTGAGNIQITCAPDECVSARPVGAPSSTGGSTENTAINDDSGLNCGEGFVDSPGVWYSVMGTDNLMTASLSSASYDTRLTVYQGGCGALSCVGDADNLGGSRESVSWCSTLGVPYLILVHGRGGASGTFTLGVTDSNCEDFNVCTDDFCSNDACVHAPDYNDTYYCCDPLTHDLTVIDDLNPCTDDICNPDGSVKHPPVPPGPNTGCDDTLVCTLDECISGACAHTDINTLDCTTDLDCPGLTTCGDVVPGFCFCEAGPLLELIAERGSLPVPGCYASLETFDVEVEMGMSDVPIVGAQFFLEYDSSTLYFVGIEPGNSADPLSEFALEFNETVDPVSGTIDYVVGTNFGTTTRGPDTVAVITFQALAECEGYVRYRPYGPNGAPNRLTAEGGEEVRVNLVDMTPAKINGTPPVLTSCPGDVMTGPDPGISTAVVSWVMPQATDSCEVGSVPVTCDPPSGSAFDPGTTMVTCTAANSCEIEDWCTFAVTVEPAVLTTNVELSSVVPGPFDRCITFDLWDCDGPPEARHATIQHTMTFTNGLASGANMVIPGGAWECITARDELHALRSTAADFSTTDGRSYTATFVGDRETGGHWLLGGNLNDDDFIDILDFGVLFPFHMSQATPDTPCGTNGPDGNINGDNQVNLLDLVIFVGNSLQACEPNCCGGGGASAASGPISTISIRELRRMGLEHLAAADLNQDGVLDMDDAIMLMNGDIPSEYDRRSIRDDGGGKRGRSTRQRPPRR